MIYHSEDDEDSDSKLMPMKEAHAIAVAYHQEVRGQSYEGSEKERWCPGCGKRVTVMYRGERDGGRFNWEARCGSCLYRISSGDRS